MSIAKRAVRLAGVLAACAPWACGAGAAGLFIENQSHQVFDGGSYDRLIVRNSDSITVRNARFAIASYGSVVSISNGENITFTGNTVHDIADDGFEIYGGTGLMIGATPSTGCSAGAPIRASQVPATTDIATGSRSRGFRTRRSPAI